MLPAPFKHLPLYCCLALPPLLASAQIGPLLTTEPMRGVRQLGDGELSCAQIHAETQALEKAAQAHAGAAGHDGHAERDDEARQ
jgi:hypothetical protein